MIRDWTEADLDNPKTLPEEGRYAETRSYRPKDRVYKVKGCDGVVIYADDGSIYIDSVGEVCKLRSGTRWRYTDE